MSIRSVLDIVLHIENFRNIDLFYQGIYFLRFKSYIEINGKKTYAHPYILCENYRPYPTDQTSGAKGNKILDNQVFNEAQLVHETSCMLTKQFIIKFCEEEVELNDICHFRIEIDTKPGFKETPLFLEAELVFIDQYTNQFGVNEKQEEQKQDPYLPEKSKVLATSKYQVRQAFDGVHEYIPVLFEDQNFCVANVMFHSVLLDYRFRVNPMQLSEFAQIKPEDRIKLIDGGNVQTKNKGDQKDVNDNESNSMYEYIKGQFHQIDFETMYKIFVDQLKQSYEMLYNHYQFISKKCILEKQKKTFKKYLQPPMKLIIPEYVTSENVREVSMAKDFNQKIIEKFRTKDPEAITHAILNEANLISGQLIQLWHKYLDLYKISPRFCSAVLEYQYKQNLKERYQIYIQKQNKTNIDMTLTLGKKVYSQRDQKSRQIRSTIQKQDIESIDKNKIQFDEFFPQPQNSPILFEEFTPQQEPPQHDEENINDQDDSEEEYSLDQGYYRGIHLFVLVHGFQGNSYDMKLLKNYLNYLHPESMFLCSSINEDQTEGNIDEMGQKLANEVTTFIYDNCPGNTLGRISFIGHSLGGVIIRSGLRFMEDYKDKFYTFMTLSSPHLGYLYHTSKIFDAGMWFLKRWKKSICLQQLSMSDKENIQECFLYKLSQSGCLKWFKNVVLLSAQQDQYAPFESARMEIGESAKSDSEKGKFYIDMAKNTLKDINPSSLYRIEINFNIQETNIDTFIGRAAHILFLESSPLIRLIVHNYEQFFN